MAMMSFNAPAEREKSLWLVRKESNPNHSQWYIDRFRRWRLRVMIWRVSLVW